jgi:hypothetical protein
MVATLSACGGGGNNNNNTPMVSVSPSTANVQEGSTQQFTANVTNSTNTAVTWAVNGVAGGNSIVGTISSTGLYTAPAIVPSPASVTVTAQLQANAGVSGNAIVTITAVTFSNASLKGTYIFSLSGIDLNGFAFNAVGAIKADGNGNITGGEEDLNDVSSGYFQASSVTGTYSLGPDGRGTLNLSSSIGSFSYAFAMRALNNAGLNEIDNNVINATGNLEQQTATGVAVPSGNYAFGFNGSGFGCGPLYSAGIFTLGSGNVGGLQDLNCGGGITQSQSLSGSYGSIDALGRGTGSFSASTGSSDFVYYVVSASRYRFMCPDPATFFLGSADLQTQASFTNTDFNGNYVVSTSANTQAGVSYTIIQFNASGGSVSTGYYDVNDTGKVGQAALTGAYSLASNGRISGSFTVNTSSLPFTMYLISPTQAYYLDLRTNAVGGGNVYAQSSAVITNAAWAGSYATKQFGYFVVAGAVLPGNSTSVSGQISADGNGTLAGTLDFNDPTNVYPGQTLQGTYNVGNVAPGRTTAAITTTVEGTRNYVAYIVDQTRVLLLETDSNLVSSGDAIRQF